MKNLVKFAASSVALISALGLGAVAANGATKDSPHDDPDQTTSSPAGGSDHPECYDARKLNDPRDFCYLTMGPWNSTKSSDEEVRHLMPIERMLAAGKTTKEIQKYYPDYVPEAK